MNSWAGLLTVQLSMAHFFNSQCSIAFWVSLT
jgi:hypothetical protein